MGLHCFFFIPLTSFEGISLLYCKFFQMLTVLIFGAFKLVLDVIVIPSIVTRTVACPLRMQVVPRTTLVSSTFFHGDFFPLLLIQEEKVVSDLQKNGH